MGEPIGPTVEIDHERDGFTRFRVESCWHRMEALLALEEGDDEGFERLTDPADCRYCQGIAMEVAWWFVAGRNEGRRELIAMRGKAREEFAALAKAYPPMRGWTCGDLSE